MTTSPTRQSHGDDPFAVLERVANHNTDAYTAWATHHIGLAAAAVDTSPTGGRPGDGCGAAPPPPHSPFHPGSAVSVAEPVTVFHTQPPVGLPLRAFASRLAVDSGGSTTDATLALLVVARFCALNAVPITAAMTARLIVAAYRVVSKATHDAVAPATEFCEVAGIAPWELARLETTVLHGVGWAVHAAIGRPAETREHGTASEAMLEDEAAERVAALANLEAPAAAAAGESSSDASTIRGKQQDRPGQTDYIDNGNSISDMHPGGGPIEESANPELPGAAVASNAHAGDFRCSPSTCSCSSSSGSSSSSSSTARPAP